MATLIIYEATIKTKCIYDEKLDAVFSLSDKPIWDTPAGSKKTLANRVLCFMLHGITSFYRILLSYYFTKQLCGRDLFARTKEVINAAESCRFLIVGIMTNNNSTNTTVFKLMGCASLSTVVKLPYDINFPKLNLCHVLKKCLESISRTRSHSRHRGNL